MRRRSVNRPVGRPVPVAKQSRDVSFPMTAQQTPYMVRYRDGAVIRSGGGDMRGRGIGLLVGMAVIVVGALLGLSVAEADYLTAPAVPSPGGSPPPPAPTSGCTRNASSYLCAGVDPAHRTGAASGVVEAAAVALPTPPPGCRGQGPQRRHGERANHGPGHGQPSLCRFRQASPRPRPR